MRYRRPILIIRDPTHGRTHSRAINASGRAPPKTTYASYIAIERNRDRDVGIYRDSSFAQTILSFIKLPTRKIKYFWRDER